MNFVQDPALWYGVAGTCAAAVYVARSRITVRDLRERNRLLAEDVRMRDDEIDNVVRVLLPALVETGERLKGSLLRHEELRATPYAQGIETVVEMFTTAVEDARDRADHSAKNALKAAMRTLQALAGEQQVAISDMQNNYVDAQLLQDLLAIDHMNSQFGRRAQVIAALCGGWTGRQRAAAPLYDVMRGAKGRIRDYLRVEIRMQSNVAVIGRAVEPVALAVAELLDNAASYSPPHTTVEINFQTVPNGVCIMVDDAGVGMHEEARQNAARYLDASEPVGITRLGHPPQFGFPVIGMLAAQYGFTVSVDTRSPYGGMRAVVMLPSGLLTTAVDAEPASVPAQRRVARVPRAGTGESRPVAPAAAAPVADEGTAALDGELPQRRRRAPLPVDRTHQPAPTDAPDRSDAETAGLMGAFLRGTRSGRVPDTDDKGQENR
ncbi:MULTISPECIES: ATP-binding protein [unclassified Embleya]|uniref:ATP-binding protein n=1 Tax=unclassified Embleya TaxID=2699296 RepID=UPI0033C2F03F